MASLVIMRSGVGLPERDRDQSSVVLAAGKRVGAPDDPSLRFFSVRIFVELFCRSWILLRIPNPLQPTARPDRRAAPRSPASPIVLASH